MQEGQRLCAVFHGVKMVGDFPLFQHILGERQITAIVFGQKYFGFIRVLRRYICKSLVLGYLCSFGIALSAGPARTSPQGRPQDVCT